MRESILSERSDHNESEAVKASKVYTTILNFLVWYNIILYFVNILQHFAQVKSKCKIKSQLRCYIRDIIIIHGNGLFIEFFKNVVFISVNSAILFMY